MVRCPCDEISRFQNKKLAFGPKYKNFRVKNAFFRPYLNKGKVIKVNIVIMLTTELFPKKITFSPISMSGRETGSAFSSDEKLFRRVQNKYNIS